MGSGRRARVHQHTLQKFQKNIYAEIQIKLCLKCVAFLQKIVKFTQNWPPDLQIYTLTECDL